MHVFEWLFCIGEPETEQEDSIEGVHRGDWKAEEGFDGKQREKWGLSSFWKLSSNIKTYFYIKQSYIVSFK